jgi:hypothetical protein
MCKYMSITLSIITYNNSRPCGAITAGHPDCGLLWLSSVPPGKFWNSITFLRYPFQVIIEDCSTFSHPILTLQHITNAVEKAWSEIPRGRSLTVQDILFLRSIYMVSQTAGGRPLWGHRTLKNYLEYSCSHAQYWQVSKPVSFNSDVFGERSCRLLTPIKVNVLDFSPVKYNDINSLNHGGRGCRINLLLF